MVSLLVKGSLFPGLPMKGIFQRDGIDVNMGLEKGIALPSMVIAKRS
jgi:hypothetical protein